ncbi:MAG TPA: hypothetical protein VI137_14495, partial [Pseudolabrys sp.]
MKLLVKLHMFMLGAVLGLVVFNPATSASPVEITNDYAAQNRFQGEAKITTEANGSISIGPFATPANIVVI